MARLKNGILGGISGKVGEVIGYIKHGKAYIKAKSNKPKVKASIRQMEQRLRMKVSDGFVNTATAFVRIGYAQTGAQKSYSANCAAKSYHIKHALKGVYPDISMDFEKVILCTGTMPGADQAEVTALASGLQFNWLPSQQAKAYHRRSRSMFFVFCEELGKSYYNLSAARLMDGTDFLELPIGFKGKLLQAYISFVSDDQKQVSTSRYLGAIQY